MSYPFRSILLVLWPTLILFFDRPAEGQWTKIGNRLLGQMRSGWGGAITYIDGHIWGGYDRLFQTTDEGVTWIDRTPGGMRGPILDIEFFDRDHGAFVCGGGRVFITSDGGRTWDPSPITVPGGVTYMGSPEAILVTGNSIYTSLDGGSNWKTHVIDADHGASCAYLGNASAAVLCQKEGKKSFIMITTDHGTTWTPQSGLFNFDSYTLDFDSCSNTLFVVNEEWYTPEDTTAKGIVSWDLGRSWATICPFPFPGGFRNRYAHSVNGSVDLTSYAWYLQTGTQGVVRSTDRGESWTFLGGPSGTIDARTIVVANDRIYAADSQGSIWMMMNAGSKPPVLTTLSRNDLFTDSVARICGVPIKDELELEVVRCYSDSIISIEIEGKDADAYEILQAPSGRFVGSNTLSVLFSPTHDGHYSSHLTISYVDGTQQVVQLGGMADLIVELVSGTLSDVTVDTLGEAACMELYVEPPTLSDDVIVQIGYDPDLQYGGAFAGDGTPLHILPTNGIIDFTIPGSKLHASRPDAVIRFDNVTALPRSRYVVVIDSLYVSTLSKGCYTTLALEAKEIDVPVECGTTALSRVLRNEKIVINVSQYHASRTLKVQASHAGHYSIVLLDMLGNIVLTEPTDITSESPAIIPYNVPSGIYLVVARGNATVSSHRVQIVE